MLNQSVKRIEKPEFEAGDFCRIAINKNFRKGTEPKYTDEIFKVISTAGQRVTLSDGKTYTASNLLKVRAVAIDSPTAVNPIDKVNKENRVKRVNKKTDYEKKVILQDRTSRTKRAPKKLDLKNKLLLYHNLM